MGKRRRFRFGDPHEAYMNDPAFVERRYEVPAVGELLSGADVVGVTRFIELPAFGPERVFTFVYRPSGIEISAAVGASSLWYSLFRGSLGEGEDDPDEPEAFDAQRVTRRSAVVALPWERCPMWLRSWEAVRDGTARAGNCHTMTMDGIGYWHRLADREGEVVAKWSNPDPREHGAQTAFIEAYRGLRREVSLYPG